MAATYPRYPLRPIVRRLFPFGPALGRSAALALACSAAPVARAQTPSPAPVASAPAISALPSVRVVSESASGVRIEVTAAYTAPLATTFEAARIDQLDARAFRVAGGEALAAEHTLALPSVATPAVTVVEADGETVEIAPGTMAGVLGGPLASAGIPGRMRGDAVGSVTVRLAQYDAATRRLTRYRRVVVDVRYGAATGDVRPLTAPVSTARDLGIRQAEAAPNPHVAVTRSALASGTWYRLPITADGVHVIDRTTIANALKLTPASLDPARLRVFGGGGQPLPALTDAPRVADLVEYPTSVTGGGDGSFDASDAVVFYARGPISWRNGTQGWEHVTHPYATETAVFVRIDDAPTPRRTPEAAPTLSKAPTPVSSVEGRQVVEFDRVMWSPEGLGSGEQWVSPLITGASPAADAFASSALPGLAAGTIRYEVRAAMRSVNVYPAATLRFTAGAQTLTDVEFSYVGTSSTDAIASERQTSFTQAYAGGAFTLAYRIGTTPAGTRPESHQGAVDWLRVFYPQTLAANEGVLRFATPRTDSGDQAFTLTGFASTPTVWDVTDPTDVRRVAVTAVGGGYQIGVAAGSTPRELVAFVSSAAGLRRVTATATRVTNQDVHGTTAFPDLAVVASPLLREQAERLAAHRRSQGLRVEVVTTEQLYNEFSGGVPDVRAVRDYFKFLYDRAPSDGQRLRYGLLVGDGHFNYRRIRPLSGDTATLVNHVFPYETPVSLDPVASYTTDDYFGLLDDGEGRMFDGERMDIAVGRLPVQTVAEARTVVDKLIRYDDPTSHGPWRSRYLFTADDAYTSSSGNFTDHDLHVQNADVIAEYVRRTAPRFDVEKVYAPSYERVYTVGWRIPAARQAILSALRDGALVFNYFGHGRDDQLADEFLFTKQDAEALDNGDRLPIFITATCSFGRWDMEDKQSGAEALVLNPNGGGIAALTTVRLVYTSPDSLTQNPGINRYLTEGLVTRLASGEVPRLGDALLYMKAKQDCPYGCPGAVLNGRKFNLLGDPSMQYGIPANRVAIERVGGVDVSSPDTTGAATAPLRALDRVTVEGSVRDPGGAILGGFTGRVTLTVFDAERTVPLPYKYYIPSGSYRVREDLIWRGEVPVVNGRFSAAFVVPKDISYADRRGRITAYATNAADHALGVTERVVVGGSSPAPTTDRTGPRVRAFVGDTTFVSGGYAAAGSDLVVRLDDETGINTVGSGVGHELLLVVNGDETSAVDLGSRFVADAGAPNRGEVRYRLADLRPGTNRLRVRAWDVVGNVTETEIVVEVAESADLDVRRVLAFPNPASAAGMVRFVFEHNQPAGTAGSVRVRVFSLDGRLVRSLDEMDTLPTGALPSGRVQIAWDGRDADGDRLAPGVYLFQVRVECEAAGDAPRQVAERIERLVVL